MSDDIVTRLRKKLVMEALGDKATYLTLGDCLDAADEIERLRAERREWFMVARLFMGAVTGENGDTNHAVDEYLRSRGRLEDPRG